MADEAFMPDRGSFLRSDPVAVQIGNSVRAWRNENGISEADLASSLHLSIEAVEAAERGHERFSPDQIVAICHTFDVQPSRFLDTSSN